MMNGFGFAPPVQRRLPMNTGMDTGAPMQPAAQPAPGGSLTKDITDLKTGLQKLGIGAPAQPSAGGQYSAPMMPDTTLPPMTQTPLPAAGPSLDDASATVSPDVASDALGGGDMADIGDMLAELFI